MPTLAELQERLDRLRLARAQGATTVRMGDAMVEYKSDGELASAIADLERQIASASGALPITTVLVTASKGLTS